MLIKKGVCLKLFSPLLFLFQPSATKHDRDNFLSEAAIIGQFTDPNVIALEGVVLKGL